MSKVLVLLFMIAAMTAGAQTPYKKHCKLTAAQRMELYPFQKNCSVWLVSFPEYDFTTPIVYGHPVPLPPFAKGKLDILNFTAYKKLSPQGMDSLTELFYCYGDNKEVNERGCLKTHYAMLFIDKDSMIYSYICFCFDEGNYNPSSNSCGIGNWCGTKLDMIHRFFTRSEIKD